MRSLIGKLRCRRAFLGVDAAILIAFFTVTMLAIYLAAPSLMSFLFNTIIGGPNGIYSYLLELPTISSPPSHGGTIGQQLGLPMVRVFSLMQTIALSMFAVVLIVAAICYVLENFRIMSEGTAANIIMNSVFTFILIFACQTIYNAVASAINIFVGWPDVGGSGVLITSGNTISTIVGYATGGVANVPLPNLDPFTGFFFSGILVMLVASILMLTLVMGLTRLFFTGVLAAILPLILVLRLIPLTKHFADTLLQDLIGFMFTSIMASIVLLFGYQILVTASLSPLTQILIAIVTLFAAAYMSTVFVGKFGALGMAAANLVGGAVNTATGAALGMAGGAVLGGGGGMASRLGSLAGKGLTKTELLDQAGRGFMSGAAPGAVSGFLSAGGGGGGGSLIMGSKGMREMGRTVMGSMQMQKASAQEFLNNRAGSTLDAVLYKNSAGDVLPTASPEGCASFMNDLDKKSGDDVFNGYVANNYPEIAEQIKDPRTAGLEVKRHLQSLSPEVAYSNWNRAQTQGSLPKEGRATFYQNARDEIGANKETVTAIQKGIYNPNLEALDASPRFAIDTFNTGTVTQKGSIANAKLFSGVKKLGASDDRRVDRLTEQEFSSARPELLGKKLAQVTGVKMTEKEQRTYGYAMGKVRDVITKRNPVMAKNMAHYVYGKGNTQLSPLMKNEKFTSQAISEMESHGTSAWLANTLNIKQREVPSLESLFKTDSSKATSGINQKSAQTSNPVIQLKQPRSRNRPVDLLEMQKRDLSGEKQW
jgi:hypothetical protein